MLRCSVASQPTLRLRADDFVLANVTVLNDANGYVIGKNYALYIDGGDRAAFFYASFYGAQDTIYTGMQRAYFSRSTINGRCAVA